MIITHSSSLADNNFSKVFNYDISVINTTKVFDSNKYILKDINLNITKGQSVALIGSNGCGKSTLLRLISGLIKPSKGKILVLGQEIHKLSSKKTRKLRSKISFIFQRHNLVPRISALSNVIHGELAHHNSPFYWNQIIAPDRVREKAYECLRRVGLTHLARQNAEKLSGGESQRTAIARALMQDAEIILADEPVASLDPKIGMEVMELFYKLAKEKNITLIFVSHDLDHALGFSERLCAIKNKSIIIDTESKKVNKKELKSIYE